MSLGTSLVTGIQNISALLPLLGTEYVEKHIGSALADGYLYSSLASISLFGSLGAVKIAFSVTTASIACYLPNLRGAGRPIRLKFVGAKWLSNAGFQPKGTVAALIGFQRPPEKEVYAAEHKLLMKLEEQHVDIAKLRFEPEKGLLKWNLTHLIMSLIFAAISILPYVHIFLDKEQDIPISPPWLFPILRALGTAGIVFFSQVIVQIRILQILRNRIIFMTTKKHHIDLGQRTIAEGWDSDRPSEECLWNLRDLIATSSAAPSNEEGIDLDLEAVKSTLAEEENRHPRILGEQAWLISSRILIIPCMLFAVVGFIGSFYLVQSANTTSGPLVWLALEAALSLVRTVIWGSKPEHDDPARLAFDFESSPGSLLVTCNKSDEEIEEEKVLPVSHSKDFLAHITTHTGPLKKIEHRDISLYYTLTGGGRGQSLYLTVLDYKQDASSIVVGRFGDGSWHYFPVMSAHWGATPQVTLGEEIEIEEADHHILSDGDSLKKLQDHINDIFQGLYICAEARITNETPSTSHSRSQASSPLPAPQKPENKKSFVIFTDWALKLWQLPKLERLHEQCSLPLTEVDEKYLQHFRKGKEAQHQYRIWDLWNQGHVSTAREDHPPELRKVAVTATINERREANEIEFLSAIESAEMEHIFCEEFLENESTLQADYDQMIKVVTSSKKSVSSGGGLYSKAAKEKQISERLAREGLRSLEDRTGAVQTGSSARLKKEWETSESRIPTEYYEPDLKKKWEDERADFQQRWLGVKISLSTAIPGGPQITDQVFPYSGRKNMIERLRAESVHMEERFCITEAEIRSIEDIEARRDCMVALKNTKKRCSARLSMVEARLEGERKLAKHKRLLLKSLVSLSEGSARKEIALMMQLMWGRRYLDISDKLIESIGVEKLIILLGSNIVTSVISVTATNLEPDQVNLIANAIKGMHTVTTVSVPLPRWLLDNKDSLADTYKAITKRVGKIVSPSKPSITYKDVLVTDQDRQGDSYLLLSLARNSQCIIRFATGSYTSHKDVRLYHRAALHQTAIDIVLDDNVLVESYNHVPHDGFGWDTCHITNIPIGDHLLIIKVGDGQNDYYISDVDIVDIDVEEHCRLDLQPAVTGQF